MKRLSATVALVFILAASQAASETEQLVLRILEKPGRKTDLSGVTPTNRGAVIMLLRDIATQKVEKIGTVLPDYIGAEVVLLRLNDTETIARLTDDYKRNYGSRGSFWLAEHLEWGAQAAVIPYLADDFFRDDGERSTIVREGSGGIRVMPRSVFSSLTILRIAKVSEQFSPEMRAWAKQRLMASIYPLDSFRTDMRVWWRQNEAAFAKGDYHAVRPLQPENEAAAAATPLPLATSRPVPSTPATPITTEAHAATVERKTPVWPWVVGIAVLTVIASLVWKRRS